MPLPIYEQLNIFKFIQVIHLIIALDRENNHYTLLRGNKLNEDITAYMCEKNFPIYHICKSLQTCHGNSGIEYWTCPCKYYVMDHGG